jgi:predicted transglutaminase-like cysteine proteinase
MSTIRHALLALLIIGVSATNGYANGGKTELQLRNALEFDETLPPIGYVTFCASNAKDCSGYGLIEAFKPDMLKITPELWSTLHRINLAVNTAIKPVSDDELYGKPEFWTYPTTAGDCEDYLLEKKKLLQKAGLPANALRITVALDETGAGHAVLTVTTTEGDYILDNRRDDIRLWSATGYTFLKRQSAHNPKHWVALNETVKTIADATTAKTP